MTFRAACAAAFLLVSATHLGAPAASRPRTPLRIVSAGPSGEVAARRRGQRGPGRVLGIDGPARPRAGEARTTFFHISPAVDGTFRWSGTTILIFTPARKLPLATKYDVIVAGTAAALSGRTLGLP